MYNQKENRSVDWDKVFIILRISLLWEPIYQPTTSHDGSSRIKAFVNECLYSVLKIRKKSESTIRGRSVSYLQPSEWRLLPASLFSKHSARSPMQAMRQTGPKWLACVKDDNNKTFVRVRGGCKTTIGDNIFKNILFFLERDRYEERSKSHFKHL